MKMTDKDFDKIRDFMLSSYGIDLSKKRVLVESRLKQPATKGGNESMEAYLVDVFKKQDLKQDMDGLINEKIDYLIDSLYPIPDVRGMAETEAAAALENARSFAAT